jgi:hypothetical protein
MEPVDNNKYIIIGKYRISKYLMGCPEKQYITNIETNESKLYETSKIFELLRNENLDAEPLHEYFDEIHGTTKEQRMEFMKTLDYKCLVKK